jgi:hypothetical protein
MCLSRGKLGRTADIPEDELPELVRQATALSARKPEILVIDIIQSGDSTSMPFKNALREVSDGIIIDLEVTPGSKHTCIPSGYNPWRKRIEVKLSQTAQKGKANEQLIEHLAALFKVSSSSVTIISGAKNSQKSILVKTVDMDLAVSVLGKNIKD